MSLRKYLDRIDYTLVFSGGGWRLTYPADSFQGGGIDLVHVVDLRGGVVVLTVTDDVDQVVVGEVGDDVAEVCERPGDRNRSSPGRTEIDLYVSWRD